MSATPSPPAPHDPAWLPAVRALLDHATPLLPHLPEPIRASLRTALTPIQTGAWTVLVTGLRSVGKSSFVCALWNDSELLPTAVRDCTQSNTVVRLPRPDEADRSLLLDYLPRERALEFATRGLAYYRLAQMLDETMGPTGPRLDECTSEEKLRQAIAAVIQLFTRRRDLAVLHEPLTEQVEQLEEFLAFLETPEYRPGKTARVEWDRRQEYLMGLRRPDGRPIGIGKLLALHAVEVIRASAAWPRQTPPPRLVDTPWVPAFHNARRAELVMEKAREADLLVVLALPERLEPEEWLQTVLHDQPELGVRTLVVFNQIDTIDPLSLYRRDGFAEAYQQNTVTLGRLGVPEQNLRISCARLPFLRSGPQNADVADRLTRLEKALGDVRKAAGSRTDAPIRPRLLEATGAADTSGDGGLTALREHLVALYQNTVLPNQARTALSAIVALNPSDLPSNLQSSLTALQQQAHQRMPILPHPKRAD